MINAVEIGVTLENGQTERFLVEMPKEEWQKLHRDTESSQIAREQLILDVVSDAGIIQFPSISELSDVARSWEISFAPSDIRVSDDLPEVDDAKVDRPDERTAKCRWVLRLANHLLPSEAREESIDEWIDEIETASEGGVGVYRRTASILVRSLPVLAWRSRMPARVRGGGS
jgi:hypothetical protein